jgi:hypothetical protein
MIKYDWSQTSQTITIMLRGISEKPEVLVSPWFIRISDSHQKRVLCLDLQHEIEFKTSLTRFSDRVLIIQAFKAIEQEWASLEALLVPSAQLKERRESSISLAESENAKADKESQATKHALVSTVSDLLLQQAQMKSVSMDALKREGLNRAHECLFNDDHVDTCEDEAHETPEQPFNQERVEIIVDVTPVRRKPGCPPVE